MTGSVATNRGERRRSGPGHIGVRDSTIGRSSVNDHIPEEYIRGRRRPLSIVDDFSFVFDTFEAT